MLLLKLMFIFHIFFFFSPRAHTYAHLILKLKRKAFNITSIVRQRYLQTSNNYPHIKEDKQKLEVRSLPFVPISTVSRYINSEYFYYWHGGSFKGPYFFMFYYQVFVFTHFLILFD